MSLGPITKSSPSSNGLQVAGAMLLAQAALRAFFFTSFLMAVSRFPRLSQVIFNNVYPLTTAIVLPAAFIIGGLVVGLMLLARARAAAPVARIFCVLGLLLTAFGAIQVGYAYVHSSHQAATQTYVLMAVNAAIYLGTLVTVTRAA